MARNVRLIGCAAIVGCVAVRLFAGMSALDTAGFVFFMRFFMRFHSLFASGNIPYSHLSVLFTLFVFLCFFRRDYHIFSGVTTTHYHTHYHTFSGVTTTKTTHFWLEREKQNQCTETYIFVPFCAESPLSRFYVVFVVVQVIIVCGIVCGLYVVLCGF